MLLSIDGFQVGVLAVGHLWQAAIARIIFLLIVADLLGNTASGSRRISRPNHWPAGWFSYRTKRGRPRPDPLSPLSIWKATARFQIRSYSLRSSSSRWDFISAGRRNRSVGRTASCASCAFFGFRAVDAWFFGQVFWPKFTSISRRQPPMTLHC